MADTPVFYVGHHESRRDQVVTDALLHQAQDLGYDMLTAPITNDHFHNRILKLLSEHCNPLETSPTDQHPLPLVTPLAPDDTNLAPGETVSQLLALSSPWIDIASPDPVVAHVSRQVFLQEVAYAAFCGIGNLIVQGPRLHHGDLHGTGVSQFARTIHDALLLGPYINISIMQPMVDDPRVYPNDEEGSVTAFVREKFTKSSHKLASTLDIFGTWDAWNIVRTVCKYDPRLYVALVLPRQSPPIPIQARWFSEPLRLIAIHGRVFVKSKQGYSMLPVAHQYLLTRYARLRTAPWLLLCDIGPLPATEDNGTLMTKSAELASPEVGSFTPMETAEMSSTKKKSPGNPAPHLSYIRYLQEKQPPKSAIERFGYGYQDLLQAPLQPLTDNLESITYEVFEKDPVKYEWYERAIEQALLDWMALNRPGSGPNGKVVVAVAGAGRGPLVTRSLNASRNAGVGIDLWAVEKNANAHVLLQRHNRDSWAEQVSVVESDMRLWKGPQHPDGSYGHVDILVSELLGSFGDNELSPECLDGVQHVLNPVDGISIPASYTAHLTPVAAPKIHADVRARTLTDPTTPETPHVVMLHQVDYLATLSAIPWASINESDSRGAMPDVQLVWRFAHPVPAAVLAQARSRPGGDASANAHNARLARLVFHCANRGMCHGLAGYFEAVLYQRKHKSAGDEDQLAPAAAGRGPLKIELSTNPNTIEAKSRDMISWFPIYFPLKNPIYVPDDSELAVSMWRQTDGRMVWYEWMVEVFAQVGGRRSRVAVSDLHSSEKNGCLM